MLLHKYQILAHLFFIALIVEHFRITHCIVRRRHTRHVEEGGGKSKGVGAPLLGDEIDLSTIDGIEQVTKLVLIKTDSLPGESDERIDGRYLNSLMETLYTGLRKPFKSVSADILGIFPSFEEVNVRCDKPISNENLEKDESIIVKRTTELSQKNIAGRNEISTSTINNQTQESSSGQNFDDKRNDSIVMEVDSNDVSQLSYKSSVQVCQAVTNDCLSMDNLVQILPPSITSFDKALVRLCPIMLFRIMNHLCDKSNRASGERQQDEPTIGASGKLKDDTDGISSPDGSNPINLNTLLRETKILKNLQNSDELISKKPQKLHKKLKTQTPYKNNGRLNANGLQQHGSVDEQLLKIRLKLTEPSIEKVWIFSLLFVILSIVVSMGGLIVLPFVKKTTRRRILTLFEGLAVGGLAGSATLHMFPQAFGLVDENYHKYFWRIFVVFFGIYLCYLCERIIKILKVMRARIRRRSQASLKDMDMYYGFPSISREISRNFSSKALSASYDIESNIHSTSSTRKNRNQLDRTRSNDSEFHDGCKECEEYSSKNPKKKSKKEETRSNNKISSARRFSKTGTRKPASKIRSDILDGMLGLRPQISDINNVSDVEGPSLDGDQVQTRRRLVQCLKSVQRQFSPVYAVHTQNPDGTPIDEPRGGKLLMLSKYKRDKRKPKKEIKSPRKSRNRLQSSSPTCNRNSLNESRTLLKKHQKQRDVETMLYHQRLSRPNNRDGTSLSQGYLQHRLTSVNDVAAGRQDQDNAARMSVDTVAWMIVFGDAVLNVIDGLSIGAAFERNILAGISISVAVMLEEVTHRLGTFAVLIRAGMSMQQSLLCTFLSACALFPGLIVGILLSDATEDATPYIFCAAGGIFLYMVSKSTSR